MENKIAHLTFTQGVINRMGSNSFILKGWCITLISAVFALSAKDSNESFLFIAYFPALMFWLLDTYYLHQEKLYRELYKQIALGTISSDTFTLDTELVSKDVIDIYRVFFTKTIFPFYGLILTIILFAKSILNA